MAENTKTYTANVEVETKDAAKNMDLLNKTISTSLGEFENLNEAIGKTQDTLGKIDPKSAEFKELSKELAGLKDRLRETESQSLRFTEALAQQPGVIGLVGQSVEGLRGTLKIFMANPIIAVLTAIAGAFLLMKESLSKTAEGQETLNKISGAFGKIIGPVMAIIEKVALPIFEKFADLLSLVAEGFSRFAQFLGVSEAKIEEASRNSSEVLKEAYDEEQKRQEEQTKKQEEEEKKRADARKAAAEKRKQEQEKAAQEEKARQDAAQKILLEAQLSLLSDRDRELKERELRFQEELKALKAAGVTDLTAFEEEYRTDQLEINKRFDDEILKQQEETNKKKADEQAKADEEAKKKKEEFDKFILESEQFKTDALQFIQDQQVANVAAVGNILTTIAGKSKKLAIAGLVLEQGANIAKVVIDTARGISAATAAAAPFVANPITAIPATANLARVIAQQKIAAALSIAGIVAGAAKGIAQINSAQIPGSSGGSGGGGGAAGASVNIPTPNITAGSAPQIQTGGGLDPTSQIAATLGGTRREPIRAYVVSNDISSQQALDRRTSSAATFG
jgi:hypothetical protein